VYLCMLVLVFLLDLVWQEKKFKLGNSSFFNILLLPFVLHGVYDFCTMFPSYYYEATDEPWAFFMPVFSIAAVIFGIYRARRMALDLLKQGYSPMNSIQSL